MGIMYFLVNYTKKEVVSYEHIPASKARELTGNPVSAAITTWYLLQNLGDQISFVTDEYGDWPFPDGPDYDLNEYKEMTDDIVKALVDAEIILDEGIAWADEFEPERLYTRKLRNIWDKSK